MNVFYAIAAFFAIVPFLSIVLVGIIRVVKQGFFFLPTMLFGGFVALGGVALLIALINLPDAHKSYGIVPFLYFVISFSTFAGTAIGVLVYLLLIKLKTWKRGCNNEKND